MNAGQMVRLARVPTLAATAVPLMVGGALGLASGREFSLEGLLAITVAALLMQVATNAMNEYGDHRHAIDTAPAPGFAGIIVSGEVPARQVLATAVACYAVASAAGAFLILTRGALMLVLGVAAILTGVLYSEGPHPVSSTPFGELLVAIVMGPIEVVSADLACAGGVSGLALVFSVPVGLMVAAILLTNNLRDIEKDRDRGRRTLAVLVGKGAGSALLLALLISPYLWSVSVFAFFHVSAAVFLVWLALPLAAWSFRRLVGGRAWPASVAIVSRLYVLTGALIALSIILGL